MKNNFFKKFCFLFFPGIITIFPSCKIAHTGVQVLQPGDITLPASVQKFVIADRTRPGKGNGQQALNIAEGILTGEGIFADRWGAQDCIEGLRQDLSQTPRFSVKIASIDTALKGTGRRQTMPPLDWNVVARMVGNDTNTALIVLEAFDSNTDIASVLVSAATATAAAQYRANANVNVYCVWRLYNLKTKTVVDEFSQNFSMPFQGNGITPHAAQSNLPTRDAMVQRAGIAAGQQYAHRISPQWIVVARDYYRKGSPLIVQGARLARMNNWKDAVDAWDKDATNSDRKIAGRASYNMALAAEQSGDVDLALQWANRAKDMGEKRSLRYIAVLQQRQADLQKLDQQMKDKK